MHGESESGKGRMGTVVGLLLFAAVGWLLWNVVPVFYANYEFRDKMIDIARTPRYRANDDKIMDLLMKEASELRINAYVTRSACRIETQEQYRRIRCTYSREVEVLPGYKHVFAFDNVADQPLV
jgi:hypothetical protein